MMNILIMKGSPWNDSMIRQYNIFAMALLVITLLSGSHLNRSQPSVREDIWQKNGAYDAGVLGSFCSFVENNW